MTGFFPVTIINFIKQKWLYWMCNPLEPVFIYIHKHQSSVYKRIQESFLLSEFGICLSQNLFCYFLLNDCQILLKMGGDTLEGYQSKLYWLKLEKLVTLVREKKNLIFHTKRKAENKWGSTKGLCHPSWKFNIRFLVVFLSFLFHSFPPPPPPPPPL